MLYSFVSQHAACITLNSRKYGYLKRIFRSDYTLCPRDYEPRSECIESKHWFVMVAFQH